MQEQEEVILNFMKDKDYVPMKAKEMALVLNIPKDRYNELIEVLWNVLCILYDQLYQFTPNNPMY